MSDIQSDNDDRGSGAWYPMPGVGISQNDRTSRRLTPNDIKPKLYAAIHPVSPTYACTRYEEIGNEKLLRDWIMH